MTAPSATRSVFDWLTPSHILTDTTLLNGCRVVTYRLGSDEASWMGSTHATTAVDETGWECEAQRYRSEAEALVGHWAIVSIYQDPALVGTDTERPTVLASVTLLDGTGITLWQRDGGLASVTVQHVPGDTVAWSCGERLAVAAWDYCRAIDILGAIATVALTRRGPCGEVGR